MKKFIFVLALSVLLGIGQGVSFAEIQLDSGQNKGLSGKTNVWFIARNARQDSPISADRVVIWDANSNDGISVRTSTTSYDALVVGVTMDAIPSVTSDATAANSEGFNNWGRVQIYGRHANVSFDSGATSGAVGSKISAHSTAGLATFYRGLSEDPTAANQVSNDSFAVSLEAASASTKDLDIFIRRF